MKQDQRNLWQRLLQHPPIYLDPNQAEEMLKKERGDTCWGYSQWDLITLRGEGAAKRAENIQRLAREVPSESWMDLTDDDAFLFNSHIWLAKRNS